MSLKYPVPKKYKVKQSQIRYKYKQSKKIKQKALRHSFAWKQIRSFHTVKSDLLIDIFDYFINIIRKWDEKAKELNGWTNCYLLIKILRNILNGLKMKFSYYSKEIKFSNIEGLYQIIDSENKKIIPINNLLFGIMVAAAEHSSAINFFDLQCIVEVMAQNQLLYLIANYSSRGRRRYQLPWETIDDPVVEYRKIYSRKRCKTIENRNKLKPDYKQPKIFHFFQPKVSFHGAENDNDVEILELLEYLDNEPPRKKQRR